MKDLSKKRGRFVSELDPRKREEEKRPRVAIVSVHRPESILIEPVHQLACSSN